MRWALPLLILLTGCAEKESAKLERQYEMMKEAGASKAELCVKQQELADAYLREENRSEYDLKKISADITCNGARMDNL